MNKALYPYPQRLVQRSGSYSLPEKPIILFESRSDPEAFRRISILRDTLLRRCGISCYPVPDDAGKLVPAINFASDSALVGEKYTLNVTSDGISVRYGTPTGAFRAQSTLLQLLELYAPEIPCQEITDWPDIERRGFMLDVSRAKVPKLEKLFILVDLMASLKMNELQLYLENFSVEYPYYPEYAHNIEGYTPFELLQLTNYAKERYIQLVPNQNSFGHMALWISQPELAGLSNDPNGGGATLNPLDPASLSLVANLYDSLLPSFDSEMINIGCDEVHGLDKGKTAELVKEKGALTVYLDHLLKINQLVRARGLRAQFWGDILLHSAKSPDIISRIPKDMIPMIWCYNGRESFAEHAQLISSLGYDYYICPGTSTWTSMFSDIDNARANILDAAECAIKYGAKGVLNTEWGDFGHIQFDFSMQTAMIYSAGVTWCLEGNRDYAQACDFADRFLYKATQDDNRVTALILRGAQCYDEQLFWTLRHDLADNKDILKKERGEFNYAHYLSIKQGMEEVARGAAQLAPMADDATLLKAEIIASADFYGLLADYMLFRVEFAEKGTIDDFDRRYAAFSARYADIKNRIKQCWNERNKATDNDCMFRLVNSAFTNLEQHFPKAAQ